MSSESSRSRLVLALFFLSGATGLLYQVVWTRQFVHVFGATVLAVSTVLAAFMGGLAAGGYYAGKRAARQSRPLRTYGILEAILAIYALAVPWILRGVDLFYASIYDDLQGSFGLLSGIRFVVSFLILLPPTFLMGATLPLLVEHATRVAPQNRSPVARLYGINTFGAVVGTAGASFVLLPQLGLSATLLFGVGVNLALAIAAVVAGARPIRTAAAAAGATAGSQAEADAATPPLTAGPTIPGPLLLGAAFALGFTALAFEVLWTRTLSLALGTTTYAFALVLTVFLLGIALGGLAATRLLTRPALAIRTFRWLPGAIGILALLALPLFGELPELFLRLSSQGNTSWATSLGAKFVLAAMPLLLPTFLSGLAFPLAVALHRARGNAAAAVGDVYAANTVGAILGSLAAGFFLIPTVGLRGGIFVCAFVVVVVSVALLLVPTRDAPRRPLAAFALAGLTAALALFLPDWDRGTLTRGGFALGIDRLRSADGQFQEDPSEMIFLEEGITTTVTVRKWRDELTMQMNGVTEASSTGDLLTQLQVGAIPLLFHPEPRDVLVLGLGSAITAAGMAEFPTVERIACLEISEAVVNAASLFHEANRRVLEDPRTEVIYADGRNHLHLSEDQWDCITSEPSNAWNAGASAMMTTEFFRTCRQRLRPGGVLCSWIQGYSLSAEAFRAVAAAARESFPHVSLWMAGWGDFFLLASDESFSIDVGRVLELGADPQIGQLLRDAGCPDALTLLSRLILAGDAMDRWIDGAVPNSDDNLYVEFEAPKLLYEDTLPALFAELHAAAGGLEQVATNVPPGMAQRFPDLRRARALETDARFAFRAQRGPEGLQRLEEALALLPLAPDLRRMMAEALSGRGLAAARLNATAPGASRDLLRAAELDPNYGEPLAHLAHLYAAAGQLDVAAEAMAEALRREPRRPEVLVSAAELHVTRREFAEAEARAREALALDAKVASAHLALGDARAGQNDPAGAAEAWRRAAELDPELEGARRTFAESRAP